MIGGEANLRGNGVLFISIFSRARGVDRKIDQA